MPKKKEEVVIDEVVETAEEVVETPVKSEQSEEYIKFKQFIQKYKAQNPAKYELKKEALLKELATK